MILLARWRVVGLWLLVLTSGLYAQDNYEIQVYGSETVAPGATMVELHNNFTVQGHQAQNGEFATNHSWHETIEITHGWNSWFETGFYVFTSANTAYGWQWVGDHIRPRVRAPESWKLPVGLSLSSEIGYQRRRFSADTWTLEVRPIIDKSVGKWYFAFDPTFEKSLHGDNVSAGWEFSPNVKASYTINKRISAGLEYYGALGPVVGFDALRDQEQQFLPAIDLDLGPKWEFNAGVGIGVTHNTDHLILKMIIGRRFTFGGRKVPLR